MSTDNKATLDQAAHTLRLFGAQNITSEAMSRLHEGHLSALIKAAMDDRLLPLPLFQEILQRDRPGRLVWERPIILKPNASNSGTLEKELSELRSWGYRITGGEGEAEKLANALTQEGYHRESRAEYYVVSIAPGELGIDSWSFQNLSSEQMLQYIAWKAQQFGLLLCESAAVLQICKGISNRFGTIIASDLIDHGSVSDFLWVNNGQVRTLKSARKRFEKDERIIFLRKVE